MISRFFARLNGMQLPSDGVRTISARITHIQRLWRGTGLLRGSRPAVRGVFPGFHLGDSASDQDAVRTSVFVLATRAWVVFRVFSGPPVSRRTAGRCSAALQAISSDDGASLGWGVTSPRGEAPQSSDRVSRKGDDWPAASPDRRWSPRFPRGRVGAFASHVPWL